MFLEVLTCVGRGGPPGGAAETSSALPQHWHNLAQMLSPHWLLHPPVPAKPAGIFPPAPRRKVTLFQTGRVFQLVWSSGFRTFCSESFRRSRWGLRRPLTSSRMRSPWRWMTSRVGQQWWSRCSVAAHSRQTGRSQGWQKSRSSWPGWRQQRTGRLRRPLDFSSVRQRTEWDAVRFCRLEKRQQTRHQCLSITITP